MVEVVGESLKTDKASKPEEYETIEVTNLHTEGVANSIASDLGVAESQTMENPVDAKLVVETESITANFVVSESKTVESESDKTEHPELDPTVSKPGIAESKSVENPVSSASGIIENGSNGSENPKSDSMVLEPGVAEDRSIKNPDSFEHGVRENESNRVEKTQEDGEEARKRSWEENESLDKENGVSKKQKIDNSVKEEWLDNLKDDKEVHNSSSVNLGPKVFNSSVEMFDYFYKFLHTWPANVDINKYEYMVLLDLIKKGHSEPAKKIGEGIKGFQIQYHPMWKSKCFFLIREDNFVDDFSFRKCVDNILPLPENMKTPRVMISNQRDPQSGGGRSGPGRGRGGRGRGGRGHNRGGFKK